MEIYNEMAELLSKVKNEKPLVHNITNYVTINDCANILLALGASPVMSDYIEDAEEMVTLASALVINIGNLTAETVKSMLAAGKKANEIGVPVILDPVGAGATKYRDKVLKELLEQVHFSVIKGNMSEIKTLCGIKANTRGVDVSIEDSKEDIKTLEKGKNVAMDLAKKLNTVVAITGVVDIISDGENTYFIKNGNEMMARITGTGCMCTALVAAYNGVTKNSLLSAVSAVITMGIAGDIAYEKIKNKKAGPGNFKVELIDAIYSFSSKDLKERGKLEQM